MKKYFLSLPLLSLLALSCQKDNEQEINTSNSTPTEFNYETTVSTEVKFQAPSYLSNGVFAMYTSAPEDGGKLIGKAKLDNNGLFDGNYILPSSLKSVYIKGLSAGLPDVTVEVENGKLVLDLVSEAKNRSGKRGSGNATAQTINSTVYSYMGYYNNKGLPYYLTNTGDHLSNSFLGAVSASLPSGQSVPANNPHYLASANSTDVVVNDSADVWITFVDEGARYKNSLGFYTYDLNNPPQSVNDISEVKIIFPNVTYTGSGKYLLPGDKVYLGKFGPNTGISWVLFQNAWNGSSVNFNARKFYSNPAFNPESTASKRQHNVQLYDAQRELLLIGYEDLDRENSSFNPFGYSTDEDFEDVIFYASASPIENINTGTIPPVTEEGPDADGDKIPDDQDDYPNDPNKAFNNYQPFQGAFTSVAFEDLWPSKGDYDFNDLVVNGNYNHITNAQNAVVEMDYKIFVDHIGATFHNGFGLQFPFPPSDVSSITGQNYTTGLISNAGNGTEIGQTNAVAMVFDDAQANLFDTLHVIINLNTPYNFSALNQAGLDPFIFADGVRSHEIHLPNKVPTDKMNMALFGTKEDASIPNQGVYYKSSSNEPWVIAISHDYVSPVERVNINNAYLKFTDWVNSNGLEHKDWYEDKSGYRNNANLQ